MSEQVEQVAPPQWRVSLVIPDLKFSPVAAVKRQVRGVLRGAMDQLAQRTQAGPVGYRVHVQYSTKGFTEEQLADSRTGRMLPPCSQSQICNLFTEAAAGVLVENRSCVLQMLTTVGWGETDAIQLTAWALDFERKEGVQ